VTHTTPPALNTDDRVAFGEDVQLDAFLDTPLEAVVHILLPVGLVEVRLALWEQEWIDAAVEVGVLRRQLLE
jgi:hypothetical protein